MQSLKFSIRKLFKNKFITSINIIGMSLAVASIILIFLWIHNEVNVNRFFKNINELAVVHSYLDGKGDDSQFEGTVPAIGNELKKYPEVVNSARIFGGQMTMLMAYEDKKYMEQVYMGEYDVFDMFGIAFLEGGKGEPYEKNKIVISEDMAKRFFGNQSAVGKILKVSNQHDFVVVGVFDDIPKNSTFKCNAMVPLELTIGFFNSPDFLNTWYNNAFRTYAQMQPGADVKLLSEKLKNRIQQELPQSTDHVRAYWLKDQYLYEWQKIKNVRIFALIAFVILVVAVVNFINLHTARTSTYAKETGLRKSIGAGKLHLVKLFFVDTIVIGFSSFLLGFFLALVSLPFFNQLTDKAIDSSIIFSFDSIFFLLALLFITIILAGSYPAFYLSSFSPVESLKGTFKNQNSKKSYRMTMVVAQFSISIVLIIASFIIYMQANYMLNRDLGFNREQSVYIKLNGSLRSATFKEEVLKIPGVLSASACSSIPSMLGWNGTSWHWEGKDDSFDPLIGYYYADEDLATTFDITVEDGAFLNKQSQNGVVINRTLAQMIGKDHLVGQTLRRGTDSYTILGIVKDVHMNRLSTKCPPIIFFLNEGNYSNFLIFKLDNNIIRETIAQVKAVFEKMEPSYPFLYTFVNEDYDKLIQPEMNLGKTVAVFSFLAIVITCLGLLGVSFFITDQKTKEIGIRKVLGDSETNIAWQLVSSFLKLCLMALVIAIPISWYSMDKWLQEFAFRTTLSWWIFALAGCIVAAITFLTVGNLAWRAASKNPIETLRYE